MKVVLISLVALVLGACSTFVPINYIPSTATRGSGVVSVGKFTYQPHLDGKVKANQFQKKHPSIGEKYTNGSIGSIVESALKKELSYAGFTLRNPSTVVITGNVTRFYDDWVGFSKEHYEVNITFNVARNGTNVYSYNAKAHIGEPKGLAHESEAVRSAVSSCISDFLSHANAKGVL